MQAEDDIAADRFLDPHKLALLLTLPELDVDEVAYFIGQGLPSNEHLNMARDIIRLRETARGWRNYMYCMINLKNNIDSLVANYCASVTGMVSDCIELFISLFYSASLVLIPSDKVPQWKYFMKGIWVSVDQRQVVNMAQNRITNNGLAYTLGILGDGVGKVMKNLSANLGKGLAAMSLFMSSFKDTCDNKESVFAMPNLCYDISRGILRIGLPDDFATLKGEVDCDIALWGERRNDMLNAFKGWMSDASVVETYLDAIGAAISEFKPRYAMVNSGTGSDGKSTFCHVVKKAFGGYCSVLPSKGLMIDTSNANDATPIANSMVNKRLCIVPDATDIVKVIESPGFKSISGGDEIYRRGLHKEAEDKTTQIKLLSIVNTNQSSATITGIASLTRVKITMWLTKRISEDDKFIIPSHQIVGSVEGVFKYEVEFLNKFGGCFMMELIARNKSVKERGYRIVVCETIRQWTREMVSPKTVLFFLSSCTEKISTNDNSTGQIITYPPTSTSTSVNSLFMAYVSWRKTAGRFSSTDPVNLQSFTAHLEFYYPILTRKTPEGFDENYIEGIRFKQEYETMGMMFSNPGNSLNSLNFLSGTLMAPVSTMSPRNSIITYPT